MRKVITNYEKLTQADFDEFLTHITLTLSGNANFPDLPEPLADITTLQSSWQKELSKSKQGDHAATAKAKSIHGILASKVKYNGDYINKTSNGNVAMLESSGYTLAKEPVYQNRPDVKIVQGENSGSGTVIIEAIPEAVTYQVEICADPLPAAGNDSVWNKLKFSTKCTISFTGLEPGKLYWVRYSYVTIDGESDYSQPKWFRVV